jgi:hypothetical protein
MANRLRTRVKTEDNMEVDMNELDDEERLMLERENENSRIAEASHFRGYSFDKWLSVFLKVSFFTCLNQYLSLR